MRLPKPLGFDKEGRSTTCTQCGAPLFSRVCVRCGKLVPDNRKQTWHVGAGGGEEPPQVRVVTSWNDPSSQTGTFADSSARVNMGETLILVAANMNGGGIANTPALNGVNFTRRSLPTANGVTIDVWTCPVNVDQSLGTILLDYTPATYNGFAGAILAVQNTSGIDVFAKGNSGIGTSMATLSSGTLATSAELILFMYAMNNGANHGASLDTTFGGGAEQVVIVGTIGAPADITLAISKTHIRSTAAITGTATQPVSVAWVADMITYER